ncbi:MAG: DUF2975 domain-containing protein [Clostridiales bacterium]|nr:DUF2975 domain-containing protein [Clostridiales bacterium]
MWNDNKSIVLSRVSVLVFFLLLIAAAVFAPWLVRQTFIYTDMPGWEKYFLITVYTGSIPAALLLISLYRLLLRIGRGEVFVRKNVGSLRRISWYCFTGAVISALSVLYYFPWAMVAVAAAFMGLIVRVVKNVFARAVALQDDADFTI